jgi:hypothetical protein
LVYFYALIHMKIMTICTLYIPEEKLSVDIVLLSWEYCDK